MDRVSQISASIKLVERQVGHDGGWAWQKHWVTSTIAKERDSSFETKLHWIAVDETVQFNFVFLQRSQTANMSVYWCFAVSSGFESQFLILESKFVIVFFLREGCFVAVLFEYIVELKSSRIIYRCLLFKTL